MGDKLNGWSTTHPSERKEEAWLLFEVGMLKNPIEIHCNPKE